MLLCGGKDCMHECVCVCVCAFACVSFCANKCAHVYIPVCLRATTKDPSGPSHWMHQYETLLSFWTPFLKQLGGGVGPGQELRGVPFEVAAHAGSPQLKPFSRPLLSCIAVTKGDTLQLVCNDSSLLPSYLQRHRSPIQYGVITCATKRRKAQADFVDKLPGIRGLYPPAAGGAKGKITSEGAGWDLNRRTLLQHHP